MVEVPQQLQNNGNRFCLVRQNEKAPFEREWQKNGYHYNNPKVVDWIHEGGNIGFLTGYGIVIFDCDCMQAERLARQLPETLVVGTSIIQDNGNPYRKKHFYYKSDLQQKQILMDYNKHLGEIQALGQQCLVPPSKHPSGLNYEVIEDRPIARIGSETLLKRISPFIQGPSKTKRTTEIMNEYDEKCMFIKKNIKVKDLLERYGFDTTRNPTKCLWHESEGGKCFSFTDDLWNCFHCGSGGNIFHLVMKHEGLSFPEAKNRLLSFIDETESEKNTNAEKYFSGSGKAKRFVPKLLADDIMKDYIFKTPRDNETIFLYQNGVYKDIAEPVIKEECNKRLGEYLLKNRANEVIFNIKASTYIDRNTTPRHLINIKNGLFNVETMELQEHDPEIFTITQIPITYNPDMDCPKIKNFIEEIAEPDDIPLLQEVCGYCLYRSGLFQKAFLLFGPKKAGKSTFLKLLTTFLGKENTSNVALQDLAKNKFSIAELYGKAANIVSDISAEGLQQTATFKQLTGEDYVKAERKYRDPFSFDNYAKLIFSCNKIPRTDDHDDAYFRRWQIIGFSNCFIGDECDPNLLEKLTTDDELSGMFNWAIAGLELLLKNRKFSNEATIEETRSLYLQKSDDIENYLNEYTVLDVDGNITKEELYRKFMLYCKEKRITPIKKKSFTTNVQMIRPEISASRIGPRGSREYAWAGIRWKDD